MTNCYFAPGNGQWSVSFHKENFRFSTLQYIIKLLAATPKGHLRPAHELPIEEQQEDIYVLTHCVPVLSQGKYALAQRDTNSPEWRLCKFKKLIKDYMVTQKVVI